MFLWALLHGASILADRPILVSVLQSGQLFNRFLGNIWLLHGPPMLVDKTSFCYVPYNYANFYRFEESSSYWSVKVVIITNLGQKQKSA